MFTLLAPTEEEYLPATHGVHTVAEVLYVPASHAVHAVVPVYPSIHVQAVIPVLPAADVESTGHDKQFTVVDSTWKMLVRADQLAGLLLEHHSCPPILDAGEFPFHNTCTFAVGEPTVILIINRGWFGFFHKKKLKLLCL